MKTILACCICSFLIVSQPFAEQKDKKQTLKPEKFKMDNGLTVILLESHKAKKVAIESFYRAGFVHEPKGKAHISHVAENMMVKSATKSYKAEEACSLFQEDEMINAETLADFVHYDYVVASDKLELVLKIESERLNSIIFAEDILKQEIPRCLQEIEFVKNNPNAGFIKFGLIGLNQSIRYGEKSISLFDNTTNLNVDDIKQFYKQYYSPDNALLVIVGDFNPENAKDMIKKYFADIPKFADKSKTAIQLKNDIKANWDLEADVLYLLYPFINGDIKENMSLILFGNYLNEQLFKSTKLKEITKNTFCSNQVYPVGELPFFVFAEAKPDVSIDKVLEMLKKDLKKVLESFNEKKFSQIKQATKFFMQSSQLDYNITNAKYEFIFAQEAINIGIKELLAGEISKEEWLRQLDNLEYKDFKDIVTKIISDENEKKVTFLKVIK